MIENAFGLLASRFRIFRRAIISDVENVIFITKAAIALHNFLMKTQTKQSTHPYFSDRDVDSEARHGNWRTVTVGDSGLTLNPGVK